MKKEKPVKDEEEVKEEAAASKEPEEGAADEKASRKGKKHGEKDSGGEKQARPDIKPAKPAAARIIRMGGRDIDGSMPVSRALCEISGVSFMMANAISKVSGLGDKPVADLTEEEKKRIEGITANPGAHGVPSWVFNRRGDPEEGTDRHMVSANLDLRRKMDINELKKRKCYRGVRHIAGLPVRGQRTRSSFRKSSTVGVSRVKKKPGEARGAKK